MGELIPFKEDGDRVTCTPTVAVVGKTFVSISGDRNADGTYSIAPTPAGGKPFGVACWDAAVGKKVTVITIDAGEIVPITVGAVALAAGASVTADANARAVVVAGGGRAHGLVLSGAAPGTDAHVKLSNHTA